MKKLTLKSRLLVVTIILFSYGSHICNASNNDILHLDNKVIQKLDTFIQKDLNKLQNKYSDFWQDEKIITILTKRQQLFDDIKSKTKDASKISILNYLKNIYGETINKIILNISLKKAKKEESKKEDRAWVDRIWVEMKSSTLTDSQLAENTSKIKHPPFPMVLLEVKRSKEKTNFMYISLFSWKTIEEITSLYKEKKITDPALNYMSSFTYLWKQDTTNLKSGDILLMDVSNNHQVGDFLKITTLEKQTKHVSFEEFKNLEDKIVNKDELTFFWLWQGYLSYKDGVKLIEDVKKSRSGSLTTSIYYKDSKDEYKSGLEYYKLLKLPDTDHDSISLIYYPTVDNKLYVTGVFFKNYYTETDKDIYNKFLIDLMNIWVKWVTLKNKVDLFLKYKKEYPLIFFWKFSIQ